MDSRVLNRLRYAPQVKKAEIKKSGISPDIPVGNPKSRLPRNLSFVVFTIVFIIYLLTLSPGVSWEHHSEDSGDLIASAYLLGIPHPTGYPLFCILGWIWSHLIPLGSVAWRMNAFSAFFGSLAAAVTVRAMWRSFDLFPRESIEKIPGSLRALASVSCGFLLAFSSYIWEQSVVTEVYTLNLFLTGCIFWILTELMAGPLNSTSEGEKIWMSKRRRLVITLGLLEGLALTNHLTSIFNIPAILLVLIAGNTRISVRDTIAGIISFILPLFLYLYLPVRSMMDPPLDWGNPETLDNFLWVITGRQFKMLMFSMLPYQMLHQITTYNTLGTELGLIGAIAAGLGICRLLLSKTRHVLVLLGITLILTFSGLFYLTSYYIWDPEGYLLPMILASAMWAGWSLVLLVELPDKLIRFGKFLAVVLLIAAPVSSLVSHYADVDLSGNYDAVNYGVESFESFDENALVIEIRYERAFTLWYYREVEYADERDDVAVIFIEHALFDWGLELLGRKYPDLELPDVPLTGGEKDADTAAWLVEHNILNRPVYIGAIVDDLVERGYRFEAVGLIYRIYPPEE